MRIPSLSARQRSILVTLVDLVIALAFASAIAVASYGGDRFRLGPFRISMRDPQRVFFWGAALAVLRWGLWWRIPPLPELRIRVVRVTPLTGSGGIVYRCGICKCTRSQSGCEHYRAQNRPKGECALDQ